MPTGVYVHVPFCSTRCIYCDFFSTTLGEEWKDAYVRALCHEMDVRRAEVDEPTRVPSLYIGGGTPSQLGAERLGRLFAHLGECLTLAPDAEVTLEANPDDVTPDWLAALRETPVNRISMGAQTLQDDLLRFLRRRHTAEQVPQAVEWCRRAGYSNVSVDLIYGLPGQTMEMWQEDVEGVLSLGVPHLSAYALSYEERTPLGRMLRRGEVREVDEETQWRMYAYLLDRTAACGMEHYEISNFCRPGLSARHNSGYWVGTPYLGLGPGAHSYDGGRVRRANLPDLKAYCRSAGDVPHSDEVLTEEERYDERVMVRLRTRAGLPLGLLSERERRHCMDMAEVHLRGGRLRLEGDVLSLTREGIFTSNDIISDLMW